MADRDLIALAKDRARGCRDREAFMDGVNWTLRQLDESLSATPAKADERGSAEPMKRRPSWRALPPDEDGQPSYNAQGTTPARDGSEPGQANTSAEVHVNGVRFNIGPEVDGLHIVCATGANLSCEKDSRNSVRVFMDKEQRAEPQGLTDVEHNAIGHARMAVRGRYGSELTTINVGRLSELITALAARASAGKETK